MTRQEAVDQVLAEGIASLAERWTLRGANGSEEVVCIQEASERTVTLALGYYSMPGVPTVLITSDEHDAGAGSVHRS